MARMTFAELNSALDACIAQGAIFNVDFQDWKTYVAGRLLETDLRAVTDTHYLSVLHSTGLRDNQDASDLYYMLSGPSIVLFPSKKLVAQVEKMLPMNNDNGYALAVKEVMDRWTPVANKFRTLKPLIVMGRKPAETPRKTPERTLENTGTCSCCGMNVKLKAGKIVQHGFTIRYGWQQGICFGRGYDPIEVSPEGAVAYNAMLANMLVRVNATMTNLVTNRPAIEIRDRYTARVTATLTDGHERYQRVLDARVLEMESEIRQIEYEIGLFTKKIETWTPGVLPG